MSFVQEVMVMSFVQDFFIRRPSASYEAEVSVGPFKLCSPAVLLLQVLPGRSGEEGVSEHVFLRAGEAGAGLTGRC